MTEPRIVPRKTGLIQSTLLSRNKLNNDCPYRKLGNDIGKSAAYYYSQMRIGLLHTLKSLVKPGSMICCTSYTIYEINNIIISAGCTPIMVDIDKDTLGPNIKSLIAAADENRASAIIYTHLHGYATELEELARYCKANNILLIEDCAQSLWLKEWQQKTGMYLPGECGDIALFSSGFFKSINTISGGILMINQNSVYHEKLRSSYSKLDNKITSDFAIRAIYSFIFKFITQKLIFSTLTFPILRLGAKYRIEFINKRAREENNPKYKPRSNDDCLKANAIQLYMLKTKSAKTLTDEYTKKKKRSEVYLLSLQKLLKAEILRVPGLKRDTYESKYELRSCYNQIPIIAKNSEMLIRYLMVNNVDIAKQHIKNLASTFPENSILYEKCDTTEEASKELILLPCYPELSISTIRVTCDYINSFYLGK